MSVCKSRLIVTYSNFCVNYPFKVDEYILREGLASEMYIVSMNTATCT